MVGRIINVYCRCSMANMMKKFLKSKISRDPQEFGGTCWRLLMQISSDDNNKKLSVENVCVKRKTEKNIKTVGEK